MRLIDVIKKVIHRMNLSVSNDWENLFSNELLRMNKILNDVQACTEEKRDAKLI